MPAIPVPNFEVYSKIIQVLDRVGGSWQWRGEEELRVVVSPRQYRALLEAEAISPNGNDKESEHGKETRKTSNS
jgi:hypothetical protein